MKQKIKEKLKDTFQKIKLLRPFHILIMTGLTVLFVVIGALIFSLTNKEGVAKAVTEKTNKQVVADLSSVVAVVGVDDATTAGNVAPNNSWPGEIISSEISQIQPQREGVITDWRVNIGDKVKFGEVLGKISAPPATPELIAMLAEEKKALVMARAQAVIADEFAGKEQLRFNALRDSVDGKNVLGGNLSLTALENMRNLAKSRQSSLRSFVERAIAKHVFALSNVTDWRYLRSTNLNTAFNSSDQSVQNKYESLLITFVEKLKSSNDLTEKDAQDYFALLVQYANGLIDDGGMGVSEFKMTAADDQEDFLEMLTDYRMAQADVAKMETEYKIMVSQDGSMVEKDRLMAHAEAEAMEASYKVVANEIVGGLYITAPRAGVVSAIYKKVGDLVDTEMSIAIVAGQSNKNLIVRMSVPNNIRKPEAGEILSVVRPGFPMNIYKIKITGIGSLIDGTGSYMADAVFTENVEWPVGSSVRIIAPENSNSPIIRFSAIWWSVEGTPHIWGVSDAGRIFARKITIGRTFGAAVGTSVEVYEGIKNTERYLISATPEIKENMLLDEIVKVESSTDESAGSGDSMGGMEM